MKPERANALHAMLEELVRHRDKKRSEWSGDRKIEIITAAELLAEPLKPMWRYRLDAAERDAVQESLHASIREEGWRAFAEGGLEAMHVLLDAASGNNGRFGSILDHRWDGIGTKEGGFWVA